MDTSERRYEVISRTLNGIVARIWMPRPMEGQLCCQGAPVDADCHAVGILLISNKAPLATSGTPKNSKLDHLFDVQQASSPSLVCALTGQPVVVEDFHATEERWSEFAATAIGVGCRSVHAAPFRIAGTSTRGALTLFRSVPGRLAPSSQWLARSSAALAGETLRLQLLSEQYRGELRRHHVDVESRRALMPSRRFIESAKGAVAAQCDISIDSAFSLLQAYAEKNHVGIGEAARGILDGHIHLGREPDIAS